MFVFKGKLYEVKKVTFGNAEKVLFWSMTLLPEIKDNHINFKMTNKKIFKSAVRGLIDLLIDDFPNIHLKSTYSFILKQIVVDTKLNMIIEKFQKANEEESKQAIHKSDYIQRFMSDVRRAIMPYQSLTYEEMNNIGFLELEEYVAELQKREIRQQQTFMNNILQCVSCVMSKKGAKEFEKYMNEMNKAYRELDNIGFDELNYMPDKMGAMYGK